MKKFFLLTSAILTLFACSSDDPEVPAGNDDPVNDAKVIPTVSMVVLPHGLPSMKPN